MGGRWSTRGAFLEIVHLKKADAESIYSALVECLKEKQLEVSRIIGMGFDGASTFSGKKTGVQTRIKNIAPHALFVHCHCHLLQLACVQAANRIKHVYICNPHNSLEVLPKRAESLKMVQQVLNLPELKIAKPLGTRWLAHERCMKDTALNDIHESTHEPEALGLCKSLTKQHTVVAIYMLDYMFFLRLLN